MARFRGCEPFPFTTGVELFPGGFRSTLSCRELSGVSANLGVGVPFSVSFLTWGAVLTATKEGERLTGVKPPDLLTAVNPDMTSGRGGAASAAGVWRSGVPSSSIDLFRAPEARTAGDSGRSGRLLDGVVDGGRLAMGD